MSNVGKARKLLKEVFGARQTIQEIDVANAILTLLRNGTSLEEIQKEFAVGQPTLKYYLSLLDEQQTEEVLRKK